MKKIVKSANPVHNEYFDFKKINSLDDVQVKCKICGWTWETNNWVLGGEFKQLHNHVLLHMLIEIRNDVHNLAKKRTQN